MCNKGNKGGRAGKVVLVGVCAVGEVGGKADREPKNLTCSAASWIFGSRLLAWPPFGLTRLNIDQRSTYQEDKSTQFNLPACT